jgi:hypothetical protein
MKPPYQPPLNSPSDANVIRAVTRARWKKRWELTRTIVYAGAAASLVEMAVGVASGQSSDGAALPFLAIVSPGVIFFAVMAWQSFRRSKQEIPLPAAAPPPTTTDWRGNERPLTLIEKKIAEERATGTPKAAQNFTAKLEASTQFVRQLKMGILRAVIDTGAFLLSLGLLIRCLSVLLRPFL